VSVKTNICRQLWSGHSPPNHIFQLCADVELWLDPGVVHLFRIPLPSLFYRSGFNNKYTPTLKKVNII